MVGLGKRFKRHWLLLLLTPRKVFLPPSPPPQLRLLLDCRRCGGRTAVTVAARCRGRRRHRHEPPCGGVGGVRATASSRSESQIVRLAQLRQLQPPAATTAFAVAAAASTGAAVAAAYAEHRAVGRAQADELPPRSCRHLVRVRVGLRGEGEREAEAEEES